MIQLSSSQVGHASLAKLAMYSRSSPPPAVGYRRPDFTDNRGREGGRARGTVSLAQLQADMGDLKNFYQLGEPRNPPSGEHKWQFHPVEVVYAALDSTNQRGGARGMQDRGGGGLPPVLSVHLIHLES